MSEPRPKRKSKDPEALENSRLIRMALGDIICSSTKLFRIEEQPGRRRFWYRTKDGTIIGPTSWFTVR